MSLATNQPLALVNRALVTSDPSVGPSLTQPPSVAAQDLKLRVGPGPVAAVHPPPSFLPLAGKL